MHRPELLAPAGSFDALRAAAWAGADAVYLGGQSFNARASAANFSNDELAKAIIFAHRSKVKVYVTVNTLLKQSELEPAVSFLVDLYNMGADAVIIQDLGLLQLAAQYVPQLERHASTQTTTTSIAGVAALKQLGAQRVVLARELSGSEVREVVNAQVLPVEIFVHGALCVAYSGQCLLSSLIGGRSGNRGQCAQPCRLPYAGDSRYPLSPKDLCLIEHVPELLRLKAASWKIEGRLKRPEYVAEVVTAYRKAIEQATQGGNYAVSSQEKARLLQAFNRGFTTGYLQGKPGADLYSGDRPDNRGVVVGRVIKTKGSSKTVQFDVAVNEGDICDLGSKDSSFVVNKAVPQGAEYTVIGLNEEASFEKVYRLVDSARNQALAQAIADYEPEPATVNITAIARLGEPLRLQACVDNCCTEVQSSVPLEESRTTDRMQTVLERQLQKLGGTPFVLDALHIAAEPQVFVSVGEINACRRHVMDLLTTKLWAQEHILQPPQITWPSVVSPIKRAPILGVSVGTPAEAAAAEAAGADFLIFGSEWLSKPVKQHWREYEATKASTNLELVLRLPRIMHTEEEAEWRTLLPSAIPIMASSPGAAVMALGFASKVYGDTGLNIMNTASAAAIPRLNSITLSFELNRTELQALTHLSPVDVEAVVHGRQLLMIHGNCMWSAQCSDKTACRNKSVLVDRKEARFQVETDSMCRSYLLNSTVLCLIDAVPNLVKAGVARLRLELAGSGPESVRATTELYRQALLPSAEREKLSDLRLKVEQLWGKLTRGHWQRGV